MTVKDLLDYTPEKVSIYNAVDADCKTLYEGEQRGIPQGLLTREVYLFGARRLGVIDVCIKTKGR